MNVAIIGATGGIGLETVQQALNKGHRVTALSRNTKNIPPHPNLVRLNGDATRLTDLKTAMDGTDALLLTVGTKVKKNTTLFSQIARVLIQAVEETRYQNPVIIITGFGAGDSKPYLSFFMRTIIYLFLKDQYKDKTLMEDLIHASNLNWEIVRPGILKNGSHTGHYRVLTSLKNGMRVGKISRADVADYLITEAERKTNLGKKINLSY